MRSQLLTVLVIAAASIAVAEQAGGVKWTAPATWKTQAPKPMRAATYTVPAAAGDKDPGELAVYYFGAGQGGGVDANIKRWVGQFQTADGKPATGQEKVAKRTISGFPVTTIDLSGTYTGGAGPMATEKIIKSGYRLLGAIVEGPQGGVFFKFTGPAKTVAASQPAFEKLLNSVSK
jgi:hypothetical protein